MEGERSPPAAAPPTMTSSDGERGGCFQLSPTCVLTLVRGDGGDMTAWFVDGSTDAIVNSANEDMLGGGGLDGAIHNAAGPELRDECLKVPEVRPNIRCPTGEARMTRAFRLPVSRVIHTAGPIYVLDDQPEVLLRNAFNYPHKEASRVAISTIKEYAEDLKEIHFYLFSDSIYQAWLETACALIL